MRPYDTSTWKRRKPDNYHQLHQLKKQSEDGGIASNDHKSLHFCKQYCVDENLVQQELAHLELMKLRNAKRKENLQRQNVDKCKSLRTMIGQSDKI